MSIRLRIAIAVAGATLAGFAVANAAPSGPGAGKVNAGVVDVALTPASGAVRLADAAIGDRTEGTLTVTNTGNLPLTATLTGSFTGDARLAGQVFVTVSGPGGVLLAARPLSAFDAQAGGLSLGRLAACPGRSCDPGAKAPGGGTQLTLRVALELRSAGGAAADALVAGRDLVQSFHVHAEQAPGS
jgi:hypothetical protein